MMHGAPEQILALTAVIYRHSVLQRSVLLALVKCYFENLDAAIGIILAYLQEEEHNATQAGVLQTWYQTLTQVSTTGEFGLVRACAWNLGQGGVVVKV